MIGANRARISACSTFAHSARLALPVSSFSCSGSAANDFTTRTPWMFSSTTVATSARRAWISHDTGNIRLRILSPAMKTNGIVESATNASVTLIVIIRMKASTTTLHCTRMNGACDRYICTARMSELAREMS